MFARAKDKTKVVSLRLRAKVTQTKTATMAGLQTISLANIPMANTHGVITAPTERMPSLHATGKATKQPKNTTAKKSLRFDDNRKEKTPLTLTAPPPLEDAAVEQDEVVEHDMVTQTTVTEEQSVESTIVPENTLPSEITDFSESPTDEPAAVPATSTGTC